MSPPPLVLAPLFTCITSSPLERICAIPGTHVRYTRAREHCPSNNIRAASRTHLPHPLHALALSTVAAIPIGPGVWLLADPLAAFIGQLVRAKCQALTMPDSTPFFPISEY